MDKLSFFVFSLLSLIAMIMYVESGRIEILFFVLFCMLAWILPPKIFELMKDWMGHGKDRADQKELKLLQERLETMENLVCRLDSERSEQFERSLLALKSAEAASGGLSQSQTIFSNVASALEERYQVLRELGRGGMGIVFQAHDKQLNEQVAVKILSPVLSNDQDALERMKREVSAARRVTHPNVIRIHDISNVTGLYYVSMEYFNGRNLREYIHGTGLTPAEFSNLAFQICDGLEAAHKQGVVHRDLKSANVIVSSNGHAKIIDFGLARTGHLQDMTAAGLIMGTPEYMAPEQVSGKRVDERADIYSLGIILYEMCTGRVPFHGDSAIATAFKQMKDDFPALNNSKHDPDTLAKLEKVLRKALDKDPIRRHRSVSELRDDLRKALPQFEVHVHDQPVAAQNLKIKA